LVSNLADCHDHRSLSAGSVPLEESEVFDSRLFNENKGDTTYESSEHEGNNFTRLYKCPAVVLWNSSNFLF